MEPGRYYLDPTREPRECPAHCHKPESGDGKGENCSICDGTGRLGEEGAEPDVETFQGHERGPHPGKWFARVKVYRGAAPRGAMNPVYGPEDTEPAALAAARKAHRKES